MDFGSADLNKQFKDSITNAYKTPDGKIQSWTPITNCGTAFREAANLISGSLGTKSNGEIKPKEHLRYMGTTLKPYISYETPYYYVKGQGSLK